MSAPQRPKRFIKRPDDKAMKAELETIRSDIKNLDSTLSELTAQIQKINLDPATAERRKTLQGELAEVITKQKSLKEGRNAVQEQLKVADATLKRKIGEMQKLTSKSAFKTAGEIDARIAALDNLIGGGSLMLAEERRYVKEMSSLRKLRKDFSKVEEQQQSIDNTKAKIAELKKKLSTFDNKECNEKFEKIQDELNKIQESNKGIQSKKSDLISKKNAIMKSKDAKYSEMRKLRADFDAEFTKFKADMADEQKRRDEEYKAEKELHKKTKLKELAEKRMEEASIPAFSNEIKEIHSLLSYFDPSYVKPQSNAVADATKPTFESKANIRQIEMPEGVVVIEKKQESFFEGTKGKKSKKKAPKNKNFTVDSDVILSLTDLSIPLPTKTDDVPKTVEILKETLTALEGKQDEQTKANIARAKAEIEKLEAESNAEAPEADEEPVEESA